MLLYENARKRSEKIRFKISFHNSIILISYKWVQPIQYQQFCPTADHAMLTDVYGLGIALLCMCVTEKLSSISIPKFHTNTCPLCWEVHKLLVDMGFYCRKTKSQLAHKGLRLKFSIISITCTCWRWVTPSLHPTITSSPSRWRIPSITGIGGHSIQSISSIQLIWLSGVSYCSIRWYRLRRTDCYKREKQQQQ